MVTQHTGSATGGATSFAPVLNNPLFCLAVKYAGDFQLVQTCMGHPI